jgi:hypothetical protein
MRKLFLVLLMVVATFAVAAPAVARTTVTSDVTLAARGGALGPHACKNGPGRYRITADVPDLESFRADVVVTGPGKYRQTSEVEEPIDGGVWTVLFFCGHPNRVGTYTVTAKVDITHTDGWNHWHTYRKVTTTFWISKR